jgi:NADPH-dependent 2,4-dienoyl-CoA reductase/sulfur reductase-like enzyme
MHLAEKGRNVTVIEMLGELAGDAAPIHYRSVMERVWNSLEKFSYILNARVTGITPEGIRYVDQDGTEHEINAGSVVLSVGARPLDEKALEFARCKAELFLIGDCNKPGNVQKLMRNAFGIASQI